MPLYDFINTETKEIQRDVRMSISAMEQYLKDNPHIQQYYEGQSAAFVYTVSGKKPDAGFRDVLKHIKSAHYKSNVNTM